MSYKIFIGGFVLGLLTRDIIRWIRKNLSSEFPKITTNETQFYYAGFKVPGTNYRMTICPLGRLTDDELRERIENLTELFSDIESFNAKLGKDEYFGDQKEVSVIRVELPLIVYSRCSEFHRQYYQPWGEIHYPFDPHINCSPDGHSIVRELLDSYHNSLLFEEVHIFSIGDEGEQPVFTIYLN